MKGCEFHAKEFLSHVVENGEPSEVFSHYNNKIFSQFLDQKHQRMNLQEWKSECSSQPNIDPHIPHHMFLVIL